ncbi:hypothetical protein [Nocardioides sp. WS12]|uniref:hypothetical protein n=1 Tax=Nocardioides sp. WS12 TaxID=2486272 RepID=UPI0015FCC3E9|nr:hypothetical protein [Nocardioides sp. WS12]
MTEPPRTDVLAERIDGLARGVAGVEARLGGLATKDELIALIQSRDLLTAQQFSALMEDSKRHAAALAVERAERMAADKENEERANRARTFALSAIGLIVSVVIALVTLIDRVGGTPT